MGFTNWMAKRVFRGTAKAMKDSYNKVKMRHPELSEIEALRMALNFRPGGIKQKLLNDPALWLSVNNLRELVYFIAIAEQADGAWYTPLDPSIDKLLREAIEEGLGK